MSCLRLIGRLIAVFFIFTLVAITPPLILAYNAQNIAVHGDFLDELFEEPDLFEALIPEIAKDLATDPEHDFENESLTRLDAQDWERIIFTATPPEDMQRWSQDAVDGFRYWVQEGGRFLEDVVIPFGEVRENIIADPEQTVLRTLTRAQSECSGGQEPLSGPNDLIPQCRPREARLETFYQRLGQRWREQPREVWRQLMPEEISRYPDDISLADYIEQESGDDVWEVRSSWRASRWGLRIAQWLLGAFIAAQCIVALGLVALFAARNWREALRWTGTPMLLIGLFTLLLALLFFVGGAIGTWFIPDKDIPIGAQEVLEDTLRAFADELWPPMSWQGGVLVLVGLGMWVLSFFAPVGREWAPAPVAATTAPPVSEPPEAISPAQTTAPVEPTAGETIAPEDSEQVEPDEGIPTSSDTEPIDESGEEEQAQSDEPTDTV